MSSSLVGRLSQRPRLGRKPPPLWILGPWRDLSLIIGTPVVIYLAFTAARTQWTGVEISSFVMVWAIGHHLPGMMRAYGDPDLFSRFRARFLIAPVFLLAASIISLVKGFAGIYAIVAVWGWWHYLMQTYGFVRIYDAKVGSFARVTRWLDRMMCVVWFAAAVVLNDNALYGFLMNFHNSGISVPAVEFFDGMRAVTVIITSVVTMLFLANLAWRLVIGESLSPLKLVLMVTTFAAFWYSASTVTNIVVAYAFFEFFHDIQYLAIVWAFNRNRVENDPNLGGFTRYLFRPRALFVGMYISLILVYGLLDYGSKLVRPGTLQQVLFGCFLTSTLLHYYFDGFIWKLRDTSTQRSLNIKEREFAHEPFVVIPYWIRHGILWSIFVLPLCYLTVTQVLVNISEDGKPRSLDEMRQYWLDNARRISQCVPESFNAQFDYGLALEQFVEDYDGAKRQYRRALEIYPEFPSALEGLARLQSSGTKRQGQRRASRFTEYFELPRRYYRGRINAP